jgi:hypothetical protein
VLRVDTQDRERERERENVNTGDLTGDLSGDFEVGGDIGSGLRGEPLDAALAFDEGCARDCCMPIGLLASRRYIRGVCVCFESERNRIVGICKHTLGGETP